MVLGLGQNHPCLSLLSPAKSPMYLTERDRDTIRHLITQQLEAFQRDDAATAFSFASPAIQAQFGDPHTFLKMVKTTYVAVYRPRSVLFEGLVELEGFPAQTVVLMSPHGQVFRAMYLMQRQPDGEWRIHGCFLEPFGSGPLQ